MPMGSLPVGERTERIVSQPRALAVVRSDGHSEREAPISVNLGGSAGGASTFYLVFDPIWQSDTKLDSAFLLLDPMPGALASPSDVELVVFRVLEEWDLASLSATTEPALGLPSSRGIARGSPMSTTRIDVTELVRYAMKHPYSHYGWAIRAGQSHDAGISVATGIAGAMGPRLELYVAEPGTP
jgi:hypothetical protein